MIKSLFQSPKTPMQKNRLLKRPGRLLVVSTLLLIIGSFSCQEENPLAPLSAGKNLKKSSELTFLKSKRRGFNKTFSIDQFISAADGGMIVTGDDTSGYSSLFFQPGDLSQDTLITFSWDSQGYITDLAPHGIVFNNPVEIQLSYKDADLSQVNEDSLQIWYYNEPGDAWELIGGAVNKVDKQVEGYIEHFSRYAIAAE